MFAYHCREAKSKVMAGLLSLPQELRDQIYEHVVVRPRTTITMLDNYECYRSEASAAQPPLLRVNIQIRAETLPMYYDRNKFLAEISDFGDLCIAKRWLSRLGDDKVRHLRRLSLCGWTRVGIGHMMCRLWIKVLFDLQSGTLEIEGNQAEVDKSRHVMKDVSDLELAYQTMVDARSGSPFDVRTLGSLMDGFHGLCTAY